MKNFFQFIFFLIGVAYSAFSQTSDTVLTDTTFWENGSKKHCIIYDYPGFSWQFIGWHPDGIMHKTGRGYNDHYERIFSSWDRQGFPLVIDSNGYHIDYYEDGRPLTKGFIAGGEREKTWMEYHPNGRLKSKGNIDYGKEGHWQYWYDNGQLESEGTYRNDDNHWMHYYANGVQRLRMIERGGLPDLYIKAQDSSGIPTLKGGNGYYTENYRNGHLREKLIVRDSIIDSVYLFHPNGTLIQRKDMTDPRSETNQYYGSLTEQIIDCWDSSGTQTFKNGNGWCGSYFDDGGIWEKIFYKDHQQDSTVRFLQNGTISNWIKKRGSANNS